MSREPIKDVLGRQYGETVRNARATYLTGEVLGMVSYVGPSNHEVMRAFARDIEKGHYEGRLVYQTHTCLENDRDTALYVVFSEVCNDDVPYMWGAGS